MVIITLFLFDHLIIAFILARSPVFAHLSASLQGLTTIRAFEAEGILEQEFDNHQDLHTCVWYLFVTCSRAFALWLDFVCVVYTAMVTFSFFLMDESGKEKILNLASKNF